MIKCLKTCEELDVSCPVKECRYWINYEKERNYQLRACKTNTRQNLQKNWSFIKMIIYLDCMPYVHFRRKT